MSRTRSNQYLAWFGHHNSYFNFRFAELDCLAAKYGVDIDTLYAGERKTALSIDPFAVVNLPSEEVAVAICNDSVMTKYMIELWGSGATDEDVIASVKENVSDESWEFHLNPKKPFSYKVIGYGIQHSEQERKDRMAAFGYLFRGYEKVNLKAPKTNLFVIDHYFVYNFDQTGTRDETLPVEKYGTYYGRLVATSSTWRNKFVLTDRPVLGPTSLDNDLAFMMANFAEMKKGTFVLDPFCGTGGLLIAATACGEIPQVGTDIDIRVLSGDFISYFRNKIHDDMTLDIFQNFKHYGLPLPEVVAADNSCSCWRASEGVPFFDVVLTDPPYGVRAGAKKIGQTSSHDIMQRDSYYPQMVGYEPNEVNKDLLDLASIRLKDDGILVFLLHIELIELFTEKELAELPHGPNTNKSTKVLVHSYNDQEFVYANECARDPQFLDESLLARVIPTHPALALERSALQILSAGTGRILVKMRRLPRVL